MSSRHASFLYLLLAAACAALILTRSPATTIVDADVSGTMSPEPGGHEAHTRPSDYFYAQRAQSDGSFPQEQYEAALQQLAVERAQGPSVSAGVPWTPVGPYNVGGRVTALAVAPGGTTLYLGAAHGGVWKSDNSGANWAPISDVEGMSSIGALAMDPADPLTVWCGTGEANGSVDSYDGNGIWRTRDGGATWKHMGLAASGRISSVVVDPQDSQHILVGVMGRQFSTGPDRGLYRSTNGGASWTRVLFVNDSTGVGDIVVNPVHPDTMFCATWERVRRNTYRRAYGPGCGIWRSVNRGATWTRLTTGLPAASDLVGRIALAIAPSRPSTVYAQVGSGSSNGYVGLGLYRTTDGGNTWTQRNTSATFTNNFGGFVWYFGELGVDPVNADRVYAMGLSVIRSNDGGAAWTGIGGSMHVDQHAIWVDPANTNHIYVGNDGGFFESVDGVTFEQSLDLPITQFYAGEVDQTDATRVFGGAQDNSTVMSVTGPFGWFTILGGDGFQVVSDPVNPSVVFAEWQNCCSGGGFRRSTSGGPSPTGTSGWVSSDRFGWNTPIVMSPSDHNTLLAGSQYVYRSVNNGVNWAKISGDLSSSPGGSLVYGTLTTLDISKTAPSLYYAGTDDGRVWRTLDGGGLWTNISAGLPTRWVTRVTADPVNSQVVYVTLSGFSSDYQAAMVYRSGDRGNTWTNISGNLPNIPANDLLVDPTDTQRLYLATDLGVWTTRNTGATWYEIGAGLPMTSVADLTLHQSARRLFAFTHGRSAWSLDLAALPVSVLEDAPAAALRLAVPHPNPARAGARIALELPRAGDAQVVIYDVIGRRVSTLQQGALAAGRHEFAWTRRDDRGHRAAAGVYFVRATSGGATRTQRLVVTD